MRFFAKFFLVAWGPANSLFLKNIGERVRHQMQTKNIKRIQLCSQRQLILCKLEPHWRLGASGVPLTYPKGHLHYQGWNEQNRSWDPPCLRITQAEGAKGFLKPTEEPASWASSRGARRRRGSEGQRPWAAWGRRAGTYPWLLYPLRFPARSEPKGGGPEVPTLHLGVTANRVLDPGRCCFHGSLG